MDRSVISSLTDALTTISQCINSIDRSLLNQELLEAVSSLPNIRIYFLHKILSADFDRKFLSVRDLDANRDFSANFDLCIGADGSYSIIRRQMMRVVKWVTFKYFGTNLDVHKNELPTGVHQ
jgi:2-polyprenyl-6-methoxyphenol hydroxylase-like FAD-dependent oxidoreductase